MADEFSPVYSGKLPMGIAAFISGSGTNFREVLKVQDKFRILYEKNEIEKMPFSVSVVVSNNPDATGLDYARKKEPKIPEVVYSSKEHFRMLGVPAGSNELRASYDSVIMKQLEPYKADLVALLGWDRILSKDFVRAYKNRITNVHPSRDPRAIGGSMNAVEEAFDLCEARIRSTFQMVDEIVDNGNFIMQSEWVNTNEALPENYRRQGMNNREALNEYIRWKNLDIETADDRKKAKKDYCKKLQDILKERGDWVIVPFGLWSIAVGDVGLGKNGEIFYKGEPAGDWGYQVDAGGLGEYGKLMEKANRIIAAEAVA